MITITMTPEDLQRIRFAYSPLDELMMSFHIYQHDDLPGSLFPWAQEVETVMGDELDLPYMRSVILPHGYMADFLSSTPENRDLPIEGQIATLRDLPPEIIRKSVQRAIDEGGETELRQQFMAYPSELMQCLIEELQLYWSRALAPHWTRIRTVLENDMLYRARELALNGVEPTLNTLSASVKYEGGVLTYNKPMSCNRREYGLAGEGLYLMPSVFKGGYGMSWLMVPEFEPALIYGARGGGNWYAETMPDAEEQLRAVIGDAPARLLVALAAPDHTSNLAKRLYLTAGAVSQQLKRLNQAGLVESSRSGYKVYYRLSERGTKLLDLFGA